MSLDADLSAADADRTRKLVERIAPLLHGQGPSVQSAALADLMAMLIAGHVVFDDFGALDRDATDALRALVLDGYVELIRDLVRMNEPLILARHGVTQTESK